MTRWAGLDNTYERRLKNVSPRPSRAYRDLEVQQVQDVLRSVDYLETRADIDKDKLAYYGFSWGASYTDGTVAVDMDPLSLLCRLATSVPPPRLHTVRYAGVLAAASPLRPKTAPKPPPEEPAAASAEPDRTGPAGRYRPWSELLARTFAVDVLACPRCHGRMRLLAMVEEPANVARFLAAMGGPTEVPRRSPGRGPPHWKSRVLRRQVLGDEDDGQGRWVPQTA